MITIIDNFSYQGAKPNFVRDQFDTLAAMKAFRESSLPPHGFITYCIETDKYYKFDIDNEIDESTGKWKEYTGDMIAITDEEINELWEST